MTKGVEAEITNLSDHNMQALYALHLLLLRLILNFTILRVSYYCCCYPHFIGGETEALRSCC